MRRSPTLIGSAVLLGVLVGCGRLVVDVQGKQVAKAGLNELAADLPQSDGFETLRLADVGMPSVVRSL